MAGNNKHFSIHFLKIMDSVTPFGHPSPSLSHLTTTRSLTLVVNEDKAAISLPEERGGWREEKKKVLGTWNTTPATIHGRCPDIRWSIGAIILCTVNPDAGRADGRKGTFQGFSILHLHTGIRLSIACESILTHYRRVCLWFIASTCIDHCWLAAQLIFVFMFSK